MTMAMFFDVIFSGRIAFTFLCLTLLIIRDPYAGFAYYPPSRMAYLRISKFDNSFGKWWNTFA